MLKPIDNGDYLDEKVSKNISIGDYELKNTDLIAVYTEEVAPNNFIAKFQWADLCQFARKAAFRDPSIKYPLRMIREANMNDDDVYYNINDSIQKSEEETRLAKILNRDNSEKKFVAVVILGECDEKMIDYMKNDEGAMGMDEVLPGSGVYRRMG